MKAAARACADWLVAPGRAGRWPGGLRAGRPERRWTVSATGQLLPGTGLLGASRAGQGPAWPARAGGVCAGRPGAAGAAAGSGLLAGVQHILQLSVGLADGGGEAG